MLIAISIMNLYSLKGKIIFIFMCILKMDSFILKVHLKNIYLDLGINLFRAV